MWFRKSDWLSHTGQKSDLIKGWTKNKGRVYLMHLSVRWLKSCTWWRRSLRHLSSCVPGSRLPAGDRPMPELQHSAHCWRSEEGCCALPCRRCESPGTLSGSWHLEDKNTTSTDEMLVLIREKVYESCPVHWPVILSWVVEAERKTVEHEKKNQQIHK